MAKGGGGGGGGGAPQGGGDNSFAPIWITVILVLIGWAVWFYWHAEIVAFIFKFKLYQTKLISYFYSDAGKFIPYLQKTDPQLVTFDDLVAALERVGAYLSFPFAVVLIVLAGIVYFFSISAHFRKTHTMQTLRMQEKSNWPQITPVTQLDLVNVDIDSGSWAMALTPLEFCKKYKLLKRDETTMAGLRPVPTATIKKDEARRVFLLQLGRYWEGPEALPPYAQALFAAFAAKINHDRDGCIQLLQQISRSAVTSRLDFSGAQALLNKHKNSKKVQEIIHKHAYVYTVMAALVAAAREDGVLPTAEFLWLKPIDRRLWYILNVTGRRTAFSEVAGPYAHLLAEKLMGRKILVPMTEEAVKALELAIKEIKLLPAELEAL